MSKFVKHRAWMWCLVFVRQNFLLEFRFYPCYSYLCWLIRAGRAASIWGFLCISRNFMHPLLVYLFAVSWLMACVVLKEKTSARPGCDMYSAQLVFVSHRPPLLTKLPILLFPLVFKNVRPGLFWAPKMPQAGSYEILTFPPASSPSASPPSS